MKKTITIKFKHLAIAAYIYMVLPIIIFFISWLRWYIGFPMAILLLVGLVVLMKTDYLRNKKVMELPVLALIITTFVFLVWIWLAGQGGFFYQTWDWHGRNAVFRDMITYSWPIIYPKTGTALVYYLMHWIIPALFGKLFGWMGGNIALAIWTFLGINISFLLVTYICRAFSTRRLLLVCAMFIFWGGLSLIGALLLSSPSMACYDEWLYFLSDKYKYGYQYSSNNTLLSWVFNQTIVPWIAIPLFLENKKVRNYAFIGLCLLPYAPLPFTGFVAIAVIRAIPDIVSLVKQKNYGKTLRSIFSIPNITAIMTILVVFFFYFRCNIAGNRFGLYVPLSDFDPFRVLILMLFYILEFGLYAFILYDKYKRDLMFWVVLISLVVIPLFQVGYSIDFCMRASIPAFFILMIMVIQYLFDFGRQQNHRFSTITLCVFLVLASAGAGMDTINKVSKIVTSGSFPLISDHLITFADKNPYDKSDDTNLKNFIVPDPESTIFYKYLSR